MDFQLNRRTAICCCTHSDAAENAVRILNRDIEKCLTAFDKENRIILNEDNSLGFEEYRIEVGDDIKITAADELGFVYALLYISEKYLGILPFWFWLDQKIEKKTAVNIPFGTYVSEKRAVKFRGWFINDEVLIMKWNVNGDKTEPWRMAFEALLRCGGNIVIPGTDKNSRIYRDIAAGMGLWITHHHAEPLGAEMFVRKYPGTAANYFEQSEKFHSLWRDAIEEQKKYKVVWSLGFRGQGDCPFWAQDTSGRYDTDEKRGALISEIIELQRQMILEKAENPYFCTNLYGEVMELYDAGHIRFCDDIIKVSADNGYGKMVTRRRDNHSTRTPSLPKTPPNHGGIYYHVSFYDLQAANHITMLPNTVDFVNDELDRVMAVNASDFWIINCSNIRPHAYYLDAVRKKWNGENITNKSHSTEFAKVYYGGGHGIDKCLAAYADSTIAFGNHEDEHAGEQFYTENTRMLAIKYMRDRTTPLAALNWLTGEKPLFEQADIYTSMCKNGLPKLQAYLKECDEVSRGLSENVKELFDSTILLQAKIHAFCAEGTAVLGDAFKSLEKEDWLGAFMLIGNSAEHFQRAADEMRAVEYGIWKGFYFNDCFADVKHTAYVLKKLMGYVRELGDNIRHDLWYRKAVYEPEDREVFSLLVLDNHMTDWELYEAFKIKL